GGTSRRRLREGARREGRSDSDAEGAGFVTTGERQRAAHDAAIEGPSLGKDLLSLEALSRDQIQLVLDTAEPLKEISERAIKKVPTLRGATIANLFFEASTR